jgi:hypothetical protein
MSCLTHHHACDCREHQIAVLIKAAQDAAVLLDDLKDRLDSICDVDSAISIIERIYTECGVLQHTAEEIPV